MSGKTVGGFNWQGRLVAAMIFVPAVSVLSIAAWLRPDRHGFGTHTQLGLAPCGFAQRTGLPCATCGMTTAFAHAAHGNLLASAVTQPAGAVLAVLTAMATLVSGYALAMGADLTPILRRVWRPRAILIMGALIIAAWIYKVLVF